MRNIYKIAGLAFTLVLSAGMVACDGDSGTSAKNDDSSSSIVDESSSSKNSSSSIATSSSNSRNDNAKSSSSVSSSSSSDKGASSSSVIPSSSSVEGSSSSVEASSSSIATNSSSSRNDGAESSSSVVESSSSSVIPSSSSEESSSSVASSSSEVVQLIPYTTECPAGHVCTYAPTEQLNPKITYGELLDTRDYQVYKTVEICDSDNANCQTWMAQNLNYADSIKTTSLKERSWCYKGYVDSCVKYGRFYTWAAAIDSVALADDVDNPQTCGFGVECDRLTADALAEKSIQGICPNDWHLPSYAELNTLLSAVGGEDVAGRALKSVSGWYNNGNGIDTYGFSALPVGYKEGRGSFDGVGKFSRFWSATETDVRGAYLIYLYYYAKYVNPNDSFKNNGYSVRCIKD